MNAASACGRFWPRGWAKPESLAPDRPSLLWVSGLFSAELVSIGQAVPIMGAGISQRRKSICSQQLPCQNAVLGDSTKAFLRVPVLPGLEAAHQRIRSGDAVDHHHVCMNTFFL